MERGGSTGGTNYRWRRWTLPAAGAAVTIAALVALSPLAGAATLKAPFTGVAQTLWSLQAGNCNGHAKITSYPTWNATNGAASGSGTATQKACPGVFAYANVYLEVGFVGGNFKVAKNASHTLTVNWTVAESGVMSVTNNTKCASGGHNYCNEAFIYSFDEGYLHDMTNQTYVYAPGYITFLLNNYTTAPTTRTNTVVYAYNFFTLWSITYNLVAGHHYQFGFQMYVLAFADVSPDAAGHTAGSASISVSLAGSGLNSLSI